MWSGGRREGNREKERGGGGGGGGGGGVSVVIRCARFSSLPAWRWDRKKSARGGTFFRLQ